MFIVEQNDNFPFNRGALLNVGFHAIQHNIINSNSAANFTCFIFHDVDMVPETEFPLYKCPTKKKVINQPQAKIIKLLFRRLRSAVFKNIILSASAVFCHARKTILYQSEFQLF